MTHYKRIQYLSDFSLQIRYLGLIALLLAIFLAASIWIVYATGWSHLVERLSQVYPQARLVEILRLIYFRLTVGFLILLPLALGLALYFSHKVAGPLVRIKRYLKLMARGEFDLAPLMLRRGDHLKEIAQLINEITSQLGPRVGERKKLIGSLQSTVGVLRSDLMRLPSAGQEIKRKVDYLAETLRILE